MDAPRQSALAQKLIAVPPRPTSLIRAAATAEGLRVCILDAAPSRRTGLTRHLQGTDQACHVVSFPDWARARPGLLADAPDVVLLFPEPEARGLSVVADIRAALPEVALVLCTATDDEAAALHAIELGVEEVIPNSQFQVRALKGIVERALARRRRERTRAAEVAPPGPGPVDQGAFLDRLGQSVSRMARRGEAAAVMVFSVEGLANVREAFGQEGLEAVMAEVAQRLRGKVRGEDAVMPLPANRVGVVLENVTSRRDVAALARRLTACAASPVVLSRGATRPLAVTCGIALFPQSGRAPAQLFAAAEASVEQLKKRGSGYRIAKHTRTETTEPATAQAVLREALDRGDIELYLQPQLDLARGHLWGFEALVRWHRRDGWVARPAELLPLFRDAALLPEFSEWSVWQATSLLRRWDSEGLPPVMIALNLVPAQLAPEGLARLTRALSLPGVPAERIELEVPHEAFSESSAPEIHFARLASTGVRLAVDNFHPITGTLGWLETAGVKTVKLDGTLLGRTALGTRSRRMVSGLRLMAQELGLEVVATRLETSAQLKAAREAGVTRAQGFFLGAPQAGWSEAIAAELRALP